MRIAADGGDPVPLLRRPLDAFLVWAPLHVANDGSLVFVVEALIDQSRNGIWRLDAGTDAPRLVRLDDERSTGGSGRRRSAASRPQVISPTPTTSPPVHWPQTV